MRRYTVQDIMALNPCQPTMNRPDAGYPESKLRHLFGDRQSVTALDICDDERVSIKDRQWVLHRLLPDQIAHEAACQYAEHALEREQAAGREPDPRSWAAIAAKRQWLRGEISDGELKAAESAAWAAVWAAASAAVWAAASVTARTAVRDAASAAARTAVWTAVWAATWAATWAAARGVVGAVGAAAQAERRWQLDTLREMIEEVPL